MYKNSQNSYFFTFFCYFGALPGWFQTCQRYRYASWVEYYPKLMKKLGGIAKKLGGVAAGGYSLGDIWFGHFRFGLENSELGLGVCGPFLTTLLLTSNVKRTLLVGGVGGRRRRGL